MESVARRLLSSSDLRSSCPTSRMHSGRQRHEIARGQPIHLQRGIGRGRTKCAGRDDIRRRCRHQPSFRQSTPLPFAVDPNQSVRLQRSQVIVHFLPRQSHAAGQRRRGCRRAEFREEPTAHGVQRHTCRCGIVDDLEVHHPRHPGFDKSFCQAQVLTSAGIPGAGFSAEQVAEGTDFDSVSSPGPFTR